MMAGIEPVGLGTDRRRFRTQLNAGMKKSCLSNSDELLQSSLTARWQVAMLSNIQANDLALKLNALAVCAVFVFVGAVLLGAF